MPSDSVATRWLGCTVYASIAKNAQAIAASVAASPSMLSSRLNAFVIPIEPEDADHGRRDRHCRRSRRGRRRRARARPPRPCAPIFATGGEVEDVVEQGRRRRGSTQPPRMPPSSREAGMRPAATAMPAAASRPAKIPLPPRQRRRARVPAVRARRRDDVAGRGRVQQRPNRQKSSPGARQGQPRRPSRRSVTKRCKRVFGGGPPACPHGRLTAVMPLLEILRCPFCRSALRPDGDALALHRLRPELRQRAPTGSR